ncbi:LysR family transcriptional regulator [Isoptericola sp. NEAU-Y5]|uniref:LysR family transcriptional regulator n=1 Tax=Isoptericola luteus TaxID=2879484 RepID=A0ABS7ZGQ3_9MICO|nr:LysR family transcriptional regulator [Isoptericola sp. NEAU-Y5]MCA5894209.1 LysR family transcriptional regulator [Isoptericola sp. NEAU-Y5]
MDLRDIEIFLTLADELHFGRTAERLHVSPARVSQAISRQERRMGTTLFERTSRRVELTAVGARLRDDLRQGYELIQSGIAAASRSDERPEGTLRLAAMGVIGHELRPVIDAFTERHPGCAVERREFHFSDPFGALRDDESDVQVTWSPVREPDIVVGPRVLTEGRVLAVPAEHALAGEKAVSIEVLGDHTVLDLGPAVPGYWEEAMAPRRTPSGRPVLRGPVARTFHEVLTVVASGEAVTPLNAHVSRYYTHPGVVYVPILDVPDTEWVLVWLRERETPEIRAFVDAARELGSRAI